MKIFPNDSYEIELFKKWKSWKLYDLSLNNLKIIHKNELLDLLSNDTFNLDEKY
jgi:hypothetical protein